MGLCLGRNAGTEDRKALERFWNNNQTAATAKMPNDPIQVRRVEGDATGRRMARAPPSMNEYRGASIRNRIRPVVSNQYEQIVKPVCSGESLVAEFAPQPAVHWLVVVFASWVVAPNLPSSDWNAFYRVARRVHPVRPEVCLVQAECAGRRAAVTFDFRVCDSTATDRARKLAAKEPGAPSANDNVFARRLQSRWPNFSDLTAR